TVYHCIYYSVHPVPVIQFILVILTGFTFLKIASIMPLHSSLSHYRDLSHVGISNSIPEPHQTCDIPPQFCRHDHLDQIQLNNLTCLRCGRKLKQRSNVSPISRIPTPPSTGDSQRTNETVGTTFATLARRRPSSSIYTESISVSDPSQSVFDRQQRNYSPVRPSLSPLPLFSNSASPTSNTTTLSSPHTNTSTTATDGDSIHTRINLTSKAPQFSRSLPSPLP